MSIGQLLPTDLIERLLAIPASSLAKVPLGAAWLLVKAPEHAGEADLAGPLLRSLERDQGGGDAVASTQEMLAVPRASRGLDGVDQIEVIAQLGSVRHVAVPLVFRLDRRLLLGRSESAHIRTVDPSVSGKHAAFGWEDGALTVSDLGSKNGTKHNGVNIEPGTPAWLQPMDRLQFGRVEAFVCDPRALRAVLLSERRVAASAPSV